MLAIGCDQAGYCLKEEIKNYLEEKGIEYKDCGTWSEDAVDYPVYAKAVVHEILSGSADRGILICGTGIGMSMTANRYRGIRAALCGDCFSAEATRLHNDANVLCMGARVTGPGLAIKITETFLETPFSGAERHARRVRMIDEDNQ
ncbi:MAG: ribose 5-phosphate isomerase B [Lachnospiraceae bacterium]|nr:ribose 5-phosphate isomerase B [Lachnospiraceae bacterium]